MVLLELYERKEERALGSTLSCVSECGWNEVNASALDQIQSPPTGGGPRALIGRARDKLVTIHKGESHSP